MALSIKNPEAELLARQVAGRAGESVTRAVIVALEERLERLTGTRRGPDLERALLAISRRCTALPDVDPRSPDEILGYDAIGTFGG